MAEQQDRTEKATPRRRQKAREKGQVPRSRDLVAITNMGGILLVFYYGIAPFWGQLSRVTASVLQLNYGRDPFAVIRALTVETGFLLLPLFLVIVIIPIAINLIQGGWVLKPLEPDFKKLNPLTGLKNIYSLNGALEAGKTLLKFGAGVLLLYHFIRESLDLYPHLLDLELWDLTQAVGHLVLKAFLWGFFFFLALALLDYLLQKRKFERSLKMSQQEVKEEHKELEGNPMIKSRIRSLQREMARRRMMEEVPKAAVIITNPQHLAVALRYLEKEMSAPQLVAKGAEAVAQRIKEIARHHGIPIVEDKPLARVLFKLDLNTFIPPDLYKAVAKIIAHVYRLKQSA
jgi:flagellar biosynthesis protein FlhB